MNKFAKRMTGALVGLAMAVGVGVAIGASTKKAVAVDADAGSVITFTINIDSVTAAGATWPTSYSTTQTTWSQTVNGVTLSFAAANFTTGTGDNLGTMQNRTDSKGCSYLVNTGLTSGYAILSVQGSSGTARNWDFYGATSTISVSNANPAVVTGGTKVGDTNTNNSEHFFGTGSTYDAGHYPYTHFAMVRVGSRAGYYTGFTVKVIELEKSSKTVTGISVGGSMTKKTYTTAENWDPSGLTVTGIYDSDPSDTVDLTDSVTWTYSPAKPTSSSVSEVVATAHYSTLVANSSAQGVTVTNAPGSLALPYSVSEAFAAIDAGTGVNDVYATGIVSYIVTEYSTQYSNITFDISADGTTSGQQLRAYRAKGDEAVNIAVGDVVVVNGNLTKYGDIYEYAADCTIISRTSPSYTVSYNANGGTGTMADVLDVPAGQYTLLNNAFTAPTGKVFSGWKANNSGDLLDENAVYSVNSDVSFYAQWADAYTVTYTAGTNGSGSYAHALQPAGSYTLLPFANLTGITASSGYRFKNYTVGGQTKNAGDTITLNSATAVTANFELIPEDTTYVFATNYATYASSWNATYGSKTLSGTEVGGEYSATIELRRTNKQSSGVGSDKPYVCPNTTSDEPNLVFTLTEAGKKIKDVIVTYEQRGSNKPTFKLFKGNACSGDTLDTATIGTKNTLSTTDLNDVSFSITGNAGKNDNAGAALVSIYISVEDQAAYGTTDHIKVTSFPNTVYHIGEKYDATGLAVTAYDGANENTANFKDVTDQVVTSLTDGTYEFADSDVPTKEMTVKYTENDVNFFADPISMHVYALAEYELVESAPADWSGNYLIVGENGSNLHAMNGSLSMLDVDGNHKTVAEKTSGVIETGQELEFTIASYSTGYSIQAKSGKYIGWGSGSGNGLTISDTPLVNSLSYDAGTIIAGSGGRRLSFNTDTLGRFRYYQTGTVRLYKLVESSDVSDFADIFLETLSTGASAVCKYNPSTQAVTTNLGDLKTAWKELADTYDLLSPADKEQFRLGVASTDSGASNVAKTLALYDFVAAKYNTQLQGEGYVSNYDFMQRGILPMSGHLPAVMDSNTTMPLVIAVATLGTAAAAGFFLFQRKRKEF